MKSKRATNKVASFSVVWEMQLYMSVIIHRTEEEGQKFRKIQPSCCSPAEERQSAEGETKNEDGLEADDLFTVREAQQAVYLGGMIRIQQYSSSKQSTAQHT